jgi:sec-independent protein translocase protein TatA
VPNTCDPHIRHARRSIPVNLGVTELLIVLAVVLLLFGSTRLPALAKSLGQAKREFEHGHEGQPDAS